MKSGRSPRRRENSHPLVRYRKALGACAAVLVVARAAVWWWALPCPSFESVRRDHRPSDLWIVDRDGRALESLRTDPKRRSLEWTPWAEVSPAFQHLLVEVEDRRFYAHPGIDVIAAAHAAWQHLTGPSRRGASTLTMQLAELLRGASGSARSRWLKKMVQAAAALKLDALWSKEQVLEAYINLVPFRGELVGLRAASRGLFGKNPSGLTLEESALLIALLRAPNAPVDQVGARACRMLPAADCAALVTQARVAWSAPDRLGRLRTLVPVLPRRLMAAVPHAGTIATTLDVRVQTLAIDALREQLRALKNKHVSDGAVLVLETATGRVAAYVGNAGAGVASAEQVDGIMARRQAGSTLKPFVYATAFDWRLLSPASLLDDSPADIGVGPGAVYRPRNYDEVFRGLVSAADALGSSMNVPAVKAIGLVGEARVLDRMRESGFSDLGDDDDYGPSLALGTVDVTLWELTEGYRQFAGDSPVFSGPTKQAIFNILASAEHRRFTFGMDSLLSLPFPAAVKTGTSKDMRDNWCIGWTADYTVGVWVGNFNGDPMWHVSGMTGAAPIWRSIMLALHPHPTGADLRYEPPAAALSRRTLTRIRYPVPDMLVGLDPDIPADLQQLPIEIDNPQPGHQIFLNNRRFSQARAMTLWPVRRGHFTVELKAASGATVDAVAFEVR